MKLKEEFGWSATIELVATWFTSSGTCFELLFCRSTRCRSTFKFATGLPFAVVRRLPRLRMSHLWYRGHAVFRNNSILFTLASPPRLLLPRGLDYEGLTRQETLRTTRRPRTMKNTTSRGRRLGLEFLREPSEVRSSRRTDVPALVVSGFCRSPYTLHLRHLLMDVIQVRKEDTDGCTGIVLRA